jgi:hypothetical protein
METHTTTIRLFKRDTSLLILGGMLILCILCPGSAQAASAPLCQRSVTANIVAIDQPVMFNRLGASNVNGMIFALERDVFVTGANVERLRPDKRPRPLVLRVRVGDCLTINLRNGLVAANPLKNISLANPLVIPPMFTTTIDDQVADRHISLNVAGMQWATGPMDDGSYVGNNSNSTVAQGSHTTYKLYAEKEGAFAARGMATTVGSDANQGNASNLLFGEVIVEPAGSAIYRGQVAEEEMRLASMDLEPTSPTCGAVNITGEGHPIIDYEARYPSEDCDGINNSGANLGAAVWNVEGKAGLPVLNMIDLNVAPIEIVHSEINALVAHGPGGEVEGNGHFPTGTYPLESVGKRNPTVPNRLEPFRDFASIFHDEPATKQAFPGFYEPLINGGSDVFNYVLAGVKDGFMINYGSGGIGSEIIANRLRVGPMHDCLTCAYEEFFLTSYTVSDPATLVDIPANVGLETLRPGELPLPGAIGPKATKALYTEDPANIHHSYTGDFAKIRNVHVGKEQHVFHLHNHQWLYNPNDDNSNYLDAQGIGPGVGYTYEINFGGSGNRNKSSGDSIFHCHFYPHFAQGMWYHWRHHDVFEAGTALQTTVDGGGWHEPFTTDPDGLGLGDGTPAAGARALPDGEVVAGVPIPAVVPLPGKPMAPMPGAVTVMPKGLTTTASVFNPTTVDLDPATPGNQVPVGSVAYVDRSIALGGDGQVGGGDDVNPGFPFWIAGIEDIVGQRPPTPPLDMLTPDQADALNDTTCQANPDCLWRDIDPAQADGWDGGLQRAALEGYAAGGHAASVESPIDFSKVVEEAQAVFYPEEGTDLEQLAMAFHAQRCRDTVLPDGSSALCDTTGPGGTGGFILNGSLPVVGAPYHEPCIDDDGYRMIDANGGNYNFFSGESLTGMNTHGSSVFNAANPRIYKGANIQYDAVLNKAGYHYPQQRIISLWQDAVPVIIKEKAGQPMLLRLNTFDCAVYHHSNLVPEAYEVDDYQVRTPTDIIGQHIHLPKWDLTSADGSANGWNYEDGTLSPGAVQERIQALNIFTEAGGNHLAGTGSPVGVVPTGPLAALPHPYFSSVAPAELAADWLGARTTTQRWFADPVVNTETVDRGLGIIFTHDHYGPSTHQQIGLYATVLAEPAGSTWVHNETGTQIGDIAVYGDGGRFDGGPTAWQAAILPPASAPAGSNVKAETLDPFREFYFEYSDFQHAYEAGVYVGAGPLGEPLGEPLPGVQTPVFTHNAGNPDWDETANNAFRFAINPPARTQISPVFPDLVLEVAGGSADIPGCPTRPCPQAIDVQDPGMFVVNYRNEPVGMRIFDPNKLGPDGKPGMQADGFAGDLAYALASKDNAGNDIVRKFEVKKASFGAIGPGGGHQVLNAQPNAGDHINGTVFPPPVNVGGLAGNDPFTPLLRTMAGDMIRVKMQAGGHEEEHNATIHGLKWLQAGSGHGKAPNSGWRNAQAGGISEQFTLSTPVVGVVGQAGNNVDYAYSMDASADGWLSGMWGITRVYDVMQQDLYMLPNSISNARIANAGDFDGPCPVVTSGRGKSAKKTILNPRPYDVTAVLANDVLPNNTEVTIADPCANASNPDCGVGNAGHVGNHPLNSAGGTLVYNPRKGPLNMGPIHDPTAILYVRTEDLMPMNTSGACYFDQKTGYLGGDPALGAFSPELETCSVVLRPDAPVEPLVLRAAAGDCLQVTLRNALPPLQPAVDGFGNPVFEADGVTPALNSATPDLASYTTLLGVVKRDRFGPQGATTFQPNLMRTSSHVGLLPQMLELDGSRDSGIHVGTNSNTIKTGEAKAKGNNVIQPGGVKTYTWYAGLLESIVVGGDFELTATPIEFGAANLQPSDVIKQGAKSLVGQLVIEPEGAGWTEDGITDNGNGTFAYAPGATRTQATVNDAFRDFSAVFTKALTHYYADSSPVEHMNGEDAGIPEDSQEAGGMAINYGIEPLWFRLGILPNAPFGNAGSGASTYGGMEQFDVYSNTKVGGDPATPVFLADNTKPFRMRLTNPYGTSRGTTFQLNGHVWQRDPYVCPGESRNGLTGACETGGIGSRAIGDNRQAFYQSAQESITPATHFDIVPTQTGVDGDYLFHDAASFGKASGLWGIVRVGALETTPEPPPQVCELLPTGASCGSNDECCSKSCRGRRGIKTCQ